MKDKIDKIIYRSSLISIPIIMIIAFIVIGPRHYKVLNKSITALQTQQTDHATTHQAEGRKFLTMLSGKPQDGKRCWTCHNEEEWKSYNEEEGK